MSYQFGIDIGGTFTDLFVIDNDSGRIIQEKVSTTPADFSRGFVNAIERAFDEHDISPAEVEHLSHGTTVATNAMLEQEGVETGLLATRGFRDVTAIGREDRSNVYELSPSKVPTFTRRRHRLGVAERVDADGEVVEPLDEDDVRRAIAELRDSDVESVAVSFLHAYRNGEHERRVGELLDAETDLEFSLSSDVMPEIREYERTLSTVIDAYIGPIVTEYIAALESQLRALDIDSTLHLMQASGGVITPENLASRSLRLINSGPAAGVIGAKRYAKAAGVESLITLDMGGTSADACVVRDGEIETTTEGELNDIPLLFPQVDVRAVGAGGGSIAWLDPANVLKVGPKSSSADPGPACYGQGGERPTVTDAALVLGYLNPSYFLGGEMELDVSAAEAALEPLCDALDQSLSELANGVLDIAATNMTQAIRLVTVEKGYDPRNFVLTCYGGAGPLFTTRLARKLDIDRALIPPAPGVLSASGLLAADKQFSFSRSQVEVLSTDSVDAVGTIFDALEAEATAVAGSGFELDRSVDLRYRGQTSKLNVEVPSGAVGTDLFETVSRRFHDQYETIYGHSNPEEAVEGVTWRVQATEPTTELRTPTLSSSGTLADAVKGTREAYTDGEFRECTVYDRYALPSRTTFRGPAIVEETESTTIIGAGSTATVDGTGSLVVTLGDDDG